ncbi:kinase-like protein, partial [Aspergillus ellipticus CBS 707.79]
MTGLLSPGRILRGQHGFYTVTGQLRDRIWTAMSENKEKVILKTTTASRLQTEKSALLYLQYKTPHVRPLVDDLSGESDLPPTLVLKQMDDDVLAASTTDQWPLWRPDIKYIAKGVLEALAVIHEEGWVHTDINPANILVNYKRNHHLLENPNPKRLRDPMRCTDVRLCGFGAAVHKKFSADALLNPQIGSPIYRSPEALLRLKWDTATDIWSFG